MKQQNCIPRHSPHILTRDKERTSFSAICWAILSLSSANCCLSASVLPKMSSSLGGGARSSSDMELMAASWAGVKVARRLGSWREKLSLFRILVLQ